MTAVRGPARKQAAPQVQAPPPPPAPASKRPSPLILAVGAVVVLGLAFMFTRGGGSPAATTPPAAAAAAGADIAHDGPVVALDSITVNLADGKFLRIGVALQLSKVGGDHNPTLDPRQFGARALDSTISVMSTYTVDDFATPKSRDKAKERLARAIVARYGGDVVGIYLTDFVMQ